MDIVDSLSIGIDISKDGNALVVMRQRGKDEIDKPGASFPHLQKLYRPWL